MPRDVLNERKHVAAAVEAKRNPPPALLAFFVFLNKNIQCLSQNRIGQNPFGRRIFFSFSLFLLNFGLSFQIRNTKTGYGFCTEEEGEKKYVGKINGKIKIVSRRVKRHGYERIYSRGFAWRGRMEIRLNASRPGRFSRLARGQKALSRAFHGIRICRIGVSTLSFV